MKKSTTKPKKVSRLVSLGYLDFAFSLDLTDNDIMNFGINLSEIKTETDLEFISKNNALMDKITIYSKSSAMNTLLYINKSSKTKTFIEFTSFNSFFLNENEAFFHLQVELTQFVYKELLVYDANDMNYSLTPDAAH